MKFSGALLLWKQPGNLAFTGFNLPLFTKKEIKKCNRTKIFLNSQMLILVSAIKEKNQDGIYSAIKE